VVELLEQVDVGGREQAWPVDVVAESLDDRSAEFRSYSSQWIVGGQQHPQQNPERALFRNGAATIWRDGCWRG
jgi:hypothetical protein